MYGTAEESVWTPVQVASEQQHLLPHAHNQWPVLRLLLVPLPTHQTEVHIELSWPALTTPGFDYPQQGRDPDILPDVLPVFTLTLPALPPPAGEAVKAAEGQLASLSKGQLQDVLRYHIVPAALPIPAGLQADKAYPTAFKGHDLRFKYNK